MDGGSDLFLEPEEIPQVIFLIISMVNKWDGTYLFIVEKSPNTNEQSFNSLKAILKMFSIV